MENTHKEEKVFCKKISNSSDSKVFGFNKLENTVTCASVMTNVNSSAKSERRTSQQLKASLQKKAEDDQVKLEVQACLLKDQIENPLIPQPLRVISSEDLVQVEAKSVNLKYELGTLSKLDETNDKEENDQEEDEELLLSLSGCTITCKKTSKGRKLNETSTISSEVVDDKTKTLPKKTLCCQDNIQAIREKRLKFLCKQSK